MGKRLIVVFGGTGYLGSRIVKALLEAGYRVRVAARRPDSPRLSGLSDQLERQPADILDEASVARAVEGADGVVNAVSLYVETRRVTFNDIHVEGAARVARCCARAGVPALVHTSGINADPDAWSAYVSARGLGEHRVREAFERTIVIRPSVLFGEGGGLMVTLEGLTRAPVIPLFGQGRTRLQPVHVRDVAQAVVAVLAGMGPQDTLYELGGAQVLSYRELVQVALDRRQRWRPMVPVPFALWHGVAALLSVMKSPPLTRDQLALMEADNVVHQGRSGFASLGLSPRGVEEPEPVR